MQAAMETNGVRPAATPCQIGNDTGSGSVAASDPDSVQTGRWVLSFSGAPSSCCALGLSCEVQRTKKAPV